MVNLRIWGRTLVCLVTLHGLAACNDSSSSNPGSPSNDTPPVTQAPTSPPTVQPQNKAPNIAGSPAHEVVVGHSYSFTPSATDADGDSLTFSIASKPSWAVFNTSTGRLSGTPGAGDVGSYEQIAITVNDGETTRILPQFAINVVQQSNGSVTLAWQPPTENTDGSPLMNLGGYKIHYGLSSGDYDSVVSVSNAGVTRYVLENLSPGKYYFAITAVSAAGAESDLSGEASKTI